MTIFRATPHGVAARLMGETVTVEAWGRDAVRVRATPNLRFDPDLPSGLRPGLGPGPAEVSLRDEAAVVANGRCRATIRRMPRGLHPTLELTFEDATTGVPLLAEEMGHILYPDARHWRAEAGPLHRLEQRFGAHDGERFWGLGQHQHGRLDQKGCVVGLTQMNTEVVIPFLVSSRGYGFVWNTPATGQVELAANHTNWVADATPQMDYLVIAGAGPAEILARYAELTGHPPPLPDWTSGFWQCKLRYRTQEEVLQVARAHRDRGVPLACLVIDFFNWTRGGEWRFDPDAFPDPSAMVTELRGMGIEPMVSIWPAVNANAETFAEMRDAGHLITHRRGVQASSIFLDAGSDDRVPLSFLDATSAEARAYHWDRVREGYADHGFRSFWLDADEPEVYPTHPDDMRLRLGEYRAVGGAYPLLHLTGYAEALEAEGRGGGMLLSRSAWLGAQRLPVVVWSGDVHSTFADLARQVRAGLNMAMSGISWWTTDIGGFKGGDIRDPAFHELLVRWFQFAVFCPITRMHGFRRDGEGDPRLGRDFTFGGADNEVWSFGPEVEARLRALVDLREALRPYVHRAGARATAEGLPPMRPLLVDFPQDPQAVVVEDAYLFGDALLVAPVLEPGAAAREVYLPQGATWRCAWTGEARPAGTAHRADAPLERIPVFVRDGRTRPW